MTLLFETVSNTYNIEKIIKSEKLSVGVYTTNYILHTESKKYFLKNYREPKEKLPLIYRAMKHFKQHDIPITLPYAFSNDEVFFELENNAYALYPYIEGIKFNRHTVDLPQAKALGEMLAKIHIISKGGIPQEFSSIIKKEKSLETRLSKMNAIVEIINKKEKITPFDKSVLDLINLKISLLNTHYDEYNGLSLPMETLVHGDFHVENVFFNKQNEIVEVFDFDKVKIKDRESEVIWAIFISFLEDISSFHDITLPKEFLSSYNSIYPLSFENIKKVVYLYYFGIFRSVWAEEDYYFNNNERVVAIIENDIKRINMLSTGIDLFINNLGEVLHA